MNNDQRTREERIAERINPDAAAMITTGNNGALAFNDASQLMEFAKMMSVAQVAIPKHLRESPGACLAVTIQASEWQMSPFAVANKSYSASDRLAYEAQLINAVILRRAPIKGRFKIEYSGDGQKRRCKVSVVLSDDDSTVEYESPEIGSITVKNSPQWKSDPDQQLFYYSSRAMCRRHFPDVLLGVYTQDELMDQPNEREVTPQRTAARAVPLNPFTQSSAIEDSQESPAIEAEIGNPLLDDFKLGVLEVNGPDELLACMIQCADFEDESEHAQAKKAVDHRAHVLGLRWNGAAFISA